MRKIASLILFGTIRMDDDDEICLFCSKLKHSGMYLSIPQSETMI